MHPSLIGQVAQDHVRSLLDEADAVRLARTAAGSATTLRRRIGLRMIAAGEKLAVECPQSALPGVRGRI